jgi:protein-S-isoprenylcysteine O-methyltransferase Ste14
MRVIAWLGSAAFVASLGYTVYFYSVTLGSSAGAPGSTVRHALVDITLFFVFAFHHSLFARSHVKRWVTQFTPAAAERSVYVWISSALLFAVCVLWQSLPGVAYEIEGFWRAPFYGVQLLGVVITARGAGVIDPLELSGVRQAAATSPNAIKVAGPFRLVRHPIYLGWILMVFAAPTLTVNRLLFATISSLYLILAIPWEEKSLVAAYGDQYRAYQRAVRWRVVPGIW